MLTKLEEQILMTVWRFKGEGYGVSIYQYLEEILEKRITMGVVYDILERLRRRGLLKTEMGTPTPMRGGMRKKFYRITDEGIRELISSKEEHDRVMDGISELINQYK